MNPKNVFENRFKKLCDRSTKKKKKQNLPLKTLIMTDFTNINYQQNISINNFNINFNDLNNS